MERLVTPERRTFRPVRVQRNGNSKVLPVPADLVRERHTELGEVYTVEVIGDAIVYRRQIPDALEFAGEGSSRVALLDDDDVAIMPSRQTIPPADWDD